MDIFKILEGKLINRNELARRMFPNNKTAGQYLYHKLNCINRLKITQADQDKVKQIINEEFKD